jgi:hypothetical protein
MQKLWLHQQCFYFPTIKYIYGRWRHEKYGGNINDRGEQVGKWLKHKGDVFSPHWTLFNSSISHLPRVVYQGVDFGVDLSLFIDGE